MYIKKKRQRKGRRRERTSERLAFEAGVDYLLSMIRLPRSWIFTFIVFGQKGCRKYQKPLSSHLHSDFLFWFL